MVKIHKNMNFVYVSLAWYIFCSWEAIFLLYHLIEYVFISHFQSNLAIANSGVISMDIQILLKINLVLRLICPG